MMAKYSLKKLGAETPSIQPYPRHASEWSHYASSNCHCIHAQD